MSYLPSPHATIVCDQGTHGGTTMCKIRTREVGYDPSAQRPPGYLDSNPKTTVSAEDGTTFETTEGSTGTNRNLY